MRTIGWLGIFCFVVLVVPVTLAQGTPATPQPGAKLRALEGADQAAKILGVSELVSRARQLHAQNLCESGTTLEELAMRQDILETVVAGSLEVDGVLAELDNERAHLSELTASLQARRDRAANLINVANLVTGSGVGIAVNALQFSGSTANVGNGIGVGSGIASTLLSIVGIRLQRGPQHSAGRIPNMLAPLFARPAVLSSSYPQPVLDFLRSAPPGENESGRSRLDQLMAEWQQFGRVGPPGSAKTDKKIGRLTSSLDDKTKLSIDDISDRFAMLADVSGRVALMKRDLAELMLSVRADKTCLR